MSDTRTRSPFGPSELESSRCVGCGESVAGPRCEHCGVAQRVGTFTVERVIGRTPYSRVYLARGADGRKVALKELLFSMVPDAEQLEAFEREAAILAQLSHPQIPRFVASFQEGAGAGLRLYLAQEYADGPSLLEKLEGHRFSEAEVRAIAAQVLPVLGYLHSLSPPVLHRDLKPANLIARADGSIALVDFGSARELSVDGTGLGTLAGTYGYSAPEQLSGKPTPRSDLFGLGASLLHLLTRQSPDTLAGPGQPLPIPASVSPSMKAFLERLVAPNPEDRFATAEEASRALATGKIVRKVRPRTLALAWGAAALLALGLGVGVVETLRTPGAAVSSESSDVQGTLAQLRASGQRGLADALEAKVNAAVAAVSASGNEGHVLLGRVVVDAGQARAQDALTQDALLDDGWFVLTAADLRRPISFRLHGYEPAVMRPTGWRNVPLQNVGEVHLKPVPVALQGKLRGKVALEDPSLGQAKVTLFLQGGSVNTSDGRRDAGEKEIATSVLPSGGEVSIGGFSPIGYRLVISAPGHETLSLDRTFERGGTVELGEVKLPKLKQVELRTPGGTISARAGDAIALEGGTIHLRQRDGRLWFSAPTPAASISESGNEGAPRAPEDVELRSGREYRIQFAGGASTSVRVDVR